MSKNVSDTDFKFSSQMIGAIFDSLSAHIAIIDENGRILETNRAWKDYSFANGLPANFDFKQINYLNVCEISGKQGISDASKVAEGIRQVINKEIEEFLFDYPCHSPKGQRWFYMRAILMSESKAVRVIISHEDITPLKLAQEALKRNEAQLKEKNLSLNELNTALKVVIQQRESDKADLEKTFLSNVKNLILPYINRLKESSLDKKDKTLVNIIDTHLNDIISPLMQNIKNADILLTPQEIQIASLVRDGKTTSEISEILFISEATVSFHRKNLRQKLGLKNSRTNLRSYLLSISQS